MDFTAMCLPSPSGFSRILARPFRLFSAVCLNAYELQETRLSLQQPYRSHLVSFVQASVSPVFLLSLAPAGGNRLHWPHCSLSLLQPTARHIPEGWALQLQLLSLLSFIHSLSFILLFAYWLTLVHSFSWSLPHLFSLKQFKCKSSNHTVTAHFLSVSSLVLDYLETMRFLIVFIGLG